MKSMKILEPGTKVKIIANTCSHSYPIGSLLEIKSQVSFADFSDGVPRYYVTNPIAGTYIREGDFKIVLSSEVLSSEEEVECSMGFENDKLNKFNKDVWAQLAKLGVPTECLPTDAHLLTNLFELWVDYKAVSAWIDAYAKLEARKGEAGAVRKIELDS